MKPLKPNLGAHEGDPSAVFANRQRLVASHPAGFLALSPGLGASGEYQAGSMPVEPAEVYLVLDGREPLDEDKGALARLGVVRHPDRPGMFKMKPGVGGVTLLAVTKHRATPHTLVPAEDGTIPHLTKFMPARIPS